MQKKDTNLKVLPFSEFIKNIFKEKNTERQQKIKEILSLREGVGSEYTAELVEALTTADQLIGPDENGNYILTKNEEMQLIDKYGEGIGDLSEDPTMKVAIETYQSTIENGEKLGALTFDYILPYEKGIYLARKEDILLYIDASTGLPIEKQQKWVAPLHKNTPKKLFDEVFKTLLHSYQMYLINKKGINFSQTLETSQKLTKDYKKLLNAIYGVYRYFYHGEITPHLAWKNSELWEWMLEFPDFKQKYPNLYLAAHELQKIKEILVNENGQVVGYIEKKGDKYGYRTPDKQWDEGLEYDDFIGPDPQGNIITVINGKKFFINDDFPYPKMEFDQIDGPDSQGNYVAHQKKKQYFIRKDGTLLTLNLSDSDTQESWDRIEKIDKNQNYILDQGESSYLVNAEGNFISNAYLDISTIDDCGYYQAITPEGGVILLDKTGKEILSQAYGKIRLLSGGEYELSLNGKIGLYTIEKDALQLECIYDEIIPLTGEVYQVRKDGTCWRWKDTGEFIVPLGKYEDISDKNAQGFYPVSKIGKNKNLTKISLGLLDQEGKEIIPCEREAIIWDKKRGYNCTRRTEDNKKLEMHYNIEENYLKNGNYGVYDKHDIDEDPKKEKERIRLQLLNTKNPDGSKKWEWVDEADKNGLFKVTTLDEEYLLTKYGMMKDPDTVIIPCEYDKISLHKDGKYLATMPDREHIYDYEGTMHHYKLGDESNADRDEKIKAYRDLCNAGRREMVDEADKNGLFKVTTVNLAELEMKCGIMKDKDTEIIPCKYDKISLLPDGTYRCLLHGEEIIIAPQR